MNIAHFGTTLGIVALAGISLYRRVRRNIGRQPLSPRRLMLRIAIFVVICVLVTVLLPLPPRALAATVGGALAGAALGLFGLRHTEFSSTPEGEFYTPHLYIGLAVIALLAGRLVYRVMQLNTLGALDMAGHTPRPAFGSPLTLGILFLTAGYHIAYSAALLRHLRSTGAAATATPAA